MSVEVTRLPCGLTVVTDSMPHLQTSTLGVWVGSGSRDEQADEHGISHLLEHMAFKGTKRRSARQIAEEIEAVGGDINAATSFETTAYYASVLKSDVPLALDVLSDILSNPTFDPNELKREQNVIVQEIGATEDAPDDLVFDYLQSSAFPGQPMGRSILGTPESVCSFKDRNLRAYLARNYRGPDMVVAATGAIDHEVVVAEVDRAKAQMKVAVDETAEAATGITEAEVNRAKAQIKVGLLMALESSGARARQLANQILTYGRPLPIEEMIARIDNVTVESTRAAGAALLARARPAIAALGPGKGLEGAAAIVESLKRRAA